MALHRVIPPDADEPPVTLYTVPEVAAMLRKSERAVYDLITRGRLTAVNAGLGSKRPQLRVRPDHLRAYIDSLETTA